jgi:hypothetical protein
MSLAVVLVVLGACEGPSYTGSVRISSHPVVDQTCDLVEHVAGVGARIEYLREGVVVNSLHLLDSNGDGVLDGKSGPRYAGSWPEEWLWLDSFYDDLVVGETQIALVHSVFVVVTTMDTYEFAVGEYESDA